jgi:HEPN domain-containing protein
VKILPTRNELRILARLRLREAECLYKSGFYDGCVYLCGYVVEFALKSRICKVLKLKEYPANELKLSKTHDFDVLKLLAGLKEDLRQGRNRELWENWSIATKWKPELRYQLPSANNREIAKETIDSIKGNPNGVLTWLAKRW